MKKCSACSSNPSSQLTVSSLRTKRKARVGAPLKLDKFIFGTPWLPNLLCKHWFASSVWNLCCWVADVPPCETSPAAKSEEERMFPQARQPVLSFLCFLRIVAFVTRVPIIKVQQTPLRVIQLRICGFMLGKDFSFCFSFYLQVRSCLYHRLCFGAARTFVDS